MSRFIRNKHIKKAIRSHQKRNTQSKILLLLPFLLWLKFFSAFSLCIFAFQCEIHKRYQIDLILRWTTKRQLIAIILSWSYWQLLNIYRLNKTGFNLFQEPVEQPLLGFRIAEEKHDTLNILRTCSAFGAAKPVTKPLETEKHCEI